MTGPNYIVLTTHRSHSLKRETSSPFRTWKGALWNPGIQPPLPSRSLCFESWDSRPSLPVTWLLGAFVVYGSRVQLCLLSWGQCRHVHCRAALGCIILLLDLFFFPFLSFLPFKNKPFQHWKWRARRIKGVVHWRAQKAEELAAHFGENVTKFQGWLSIPLNLNIPDVHLIRLVVIGSSAQSWRRNSISLSWKRRKKELIAGDDIMCARRVNVVFSIRA